VLAVCVDHPHAQVGIAIQLAVRETQLLQHLEVGGVALVGSVQTDEQQVPVPVDGHAFSHGTSVGGINPSIR
jgi:hypothetical protein